MSSPREFVEHAYPEPSIRSTVLLQLAESINAADAISSSCWSVSFRRNVIRLNIGRLEMLMLRENQLDMTVDRDATDEAEWQYIRERLGIVFRGNGEPFKLIPSAYGLLLPADRIEELLPRLRPLHLALVPRAAGTVQTRLPYYKAHDPEVMAYLRQEVAEDLPDPDYGVISDDADTAARRYWKISLGIGGDHWPEARQLGWIGVNWSAPDLRTLEAASPQELQQRLNTIFPDQSFSHAAAKQLWVFLHEMAPGDRVCSYGSGQVLGWGEITGDYDFDEDANDFPHRRDAAWESTEPIHTSTLPAELADKLKQNTTIIELTEAEFGQITGEDDLPVTGYWWVNQGATFEQERAGEYLWAPKKGKVGQVNKFWTDMEKLQVGDLVVHYADAAIRAISKVREPTVDAPRPAEVPAESQAEIGYYARVEYFPLKLPIRLQ
jgi:hypothetical protein